MSCFLFKGCVCFPIYWMCSMYTSYMRGSDVFVCSLFEHNSRTYLRLLTVRNIDEYRATLAEFYPDVPWNTDDHRAWFNLAVNLSAAREKIDAIMLALNFVAVKDAVDLYVLGGGELQRDKIFDAVRTFIAEEFDANSDGDLVKDLKSHIFSNLCTVKQQVCENLKPEYPPKYNADAIPDDFALVCEVKGYSTDPWNATHPIVWSMDAVKDLIVSMNQLGFKQMANTATRSSFWAVDEVFNVRSKAPSIKLSSADIAALYDILGNIDCSYVKNGGYLNAMLTLDDFYKDELNSTLMTYESPVGIDTCLDKHAPWGYESVLTDKEKRETQAAHVQVAKVPVPHRVQAFANVLTNTVKCRYSSESSYDIILPEFKVITTVPVTSPESGKALLAAFDYLQNSSSFVQGDLVQLLQAVNTFKKPEAADKNSNIASAVASDENEASIAPPTVRSVIEFLIKTNNLAPTTIWTPSSTMTDILNSFLEALRAKSCEVFGHLSCQRNQLSIILSDIVPKKRFVAGQMFQVQPCPQMVIHNAVAQLLDMHRKKKQPSVEQFSNYFCSGPKKPKFRA